MTSYFKDLALPLFDNGYRPFPIRPHAKSPFLSKGESWKTEITQDIITQWTQNGKGEGGVGISGIGAIDFDIKDTQVSIKLIDHLKSNTTTDNLLIRIGLPPKFLIPISATSAIPNKWRNTWYDTSGQKHEIEFLSAADQYFVAFGIHPETKRPYQWQAKKSLLEVKAQALPIMDALDLAAIEDTFDTIAHGLGWRRDDRATSSPRGGEKETTPAKELLTIKVSGTRDTPKLREELAKWVSFLPPKYCDDRDLWIKIGAAIHHECGGSDEGWALFDKWSRQSKKYTGDDYVRAGH